MQRKLIWLLIVIVLALGRAPDSIADSTATFSISNFGAACDWNGTTGTDDTASINLAFAAALASAIYNPQYTAVKVTGCPSQGVSLIGTRGIGINATEFNIWQSSGNGLSAGKLIIQDLNIYCKDTNSAGIVCLDTADSINVERRDTQIRGDQTTPPLIGVQEANPISGHACCIHHNFSNQTAGYFVFAACYNMSSESTNYYDDICVNGLTGRGSVASIGFSSTLTGCTALAATYNAVVATGGSGVNLTFQVKMTSGGAVSTVTIDNAGWGYFTTDTPSIPFNATNFTGAGCTGGSIALTINNVVAFGAVADGQDHWEGPTSNSFHWTGMTTTQDTTLSFTQYNWYGGSIRSNTASIWIAASTSAHFFRTYMNSESSSLAFPCVWFYDRSNIGGLQNSNTYFEGSRCEANKTGGVGDFYFTGLNTAPTLNNLYAHIDYEKGNAPNGTTSSVFNVDAGTAFATNTIALPGLDLALNYPYKINTFPIGKAHYFQASGRVQAQVPYDFNYPGFWSGSICSGQFLTTNTTPMTCAALGAIDTIGTLQTQVAWAGSCAHLVYGTHYTGPLCRIQRASDSTQMDLYADSSGTANIGQFIGFCTNTTCTVATLYDQSGNGNNATQATAANQPTIAIDANLNNRLTMQWPTSAGAVSLSVTGATAINNIFGKTGGAAIAIALWRQTAATSLGRLLYKSDGSTVGWDLRTNGAASGKIEFVQQASTSASDYITTQTLTSGTTNVFDMEYVSACGTTPTQAINGTAATYGTSTACVGTPGADTGSQNLIIGNNVASAGTNSFSGNIGEIDIWAFTSTSNELSANQLEGLRRNQAWFYNMTSPVVQ